LDISPDNRLLAGAGDDETVRLWKLENCQDSGCPVSVEMKGHQDFVFCVKFSRTVACWPPAAAISR
jgi:WD40 repeat protein